MRTDSLKITIAEIKEKQADKAVTKELRENLQKELVKNTVPKEKPKTQPVVVGGEIEVGDWVKFVDSETTATVLEINRNELVLAIGDLRSNVKKNRVQKISNKEAKKVAQSSAGSFAGRMNEAVSGFRAELDLRGKRTEDALFEVEKYLDKAIMLGFPSIKLIHGKGDGILRKMIREYLKKYSQVNRMEDEHADRGGDGITYVYLN